MAVLSQLRMDPEFHTFAFAGGKGRGHLMRKMTDELVREGKRVLITGLNAKKLPVSGSLIIAKDADILVSQIQKEAAKNPVVYVGKNIDDNIVTGFQADELKTIMAQLEDFEVLIELGTATEKMISDPTTISRWLKDDIWDELIYCFEISIIDSSLSESYVENLSRFTKNFPRGSTLSQEKFLTYLTNPKIGMGKLFNQKWPTILVFTDAHLVSLENRAISLAREAIRKGIKHIALADWETDLIKKIVLDE